jgi:hypothetical protein
MPALWAWSLEQKPRNQSRRSEQSLRQPIESFRCFSPLATCVSGEAMCGEFKVAFCNCLIPVSLPMELERGRTRAGCK